MGSLRSQGHWRPRNCCPGRGTVPGHHGQGQKGKRWPPCQGQTSSRQDAEFCLMKAWSQTKTNACALYVRVGVEFLCTFACAKESGSHAPQDPVKSFLCLKTQGIQTHSWWDETGPERMLKLSWAKPSAASEGIQDCFPWRSISEMELCCQVNPYASPPPPHRGGPRSFSWGGLL